MAQQRERTKRNKQLMVGNFKGMETVIDSSALGLDVANMARNVSWDPDGGISRREGSKEVYDNKTDIDFFIKKKTGIIDGREIRGIGAANPPTVGNKLDISLTPLKASSSGPTKGAKTFVVFPKITSNGYTHYDGLIKDKLYHHPVSGPIVIMLSAPLRDSKGRSISVKTPYITQVDNMDNLANIAYYKDNQKRVSYTNDKNEFVELNNVLGNHDSPANNVYEGIYERATENSIWMGVEPGTTNLWSVVHDTEDIYCIAPSGLKFAIGKWNGSEENKKAHKSIFNETCAYKLAQIDGDWHLLFLKEIIDKKSDLTKASRTGNVSRVDLGDHWSVMSYTVAPNGDILALLTFYNISYLDDVNGTASIIWFHRRKADGTIERMVLGQNITGVNGGDDLYTIFHKLDRTAPLRYRPTIFTTGEGDAYKINVSITKIYGPGGSVVADMYTSYGISNNFFEIIEETPGVYKYKASTKHVDSCLHYGVTPLGGFFPETIYDEYADRLIYTADSKNEFVSDYVPRVAEIPEGAKIFKIGLPADLFTDTSSITLTVLDKDGNPVTDGELQLNKLVHEKNVSDKAWAQDGTARYILSKDIDAQMKYVEVFEAIEDTAITDIKIKNVLKSGNKMIGELLDVSVIISDTGLLSVLDKENKELDIYANSKKEKYFKLYDGTYKTEDISWTYINDSIVISTPDDAFVITVTLVKDENGKDQYIVYIKTIFELADKITYSQAVANGLNRLSENPLKIVKSDNELVGPNHEFQDIIITDQDGNLALTIAPGKHYSVHPQVMIKDDLSTYLRSYTWTLKQLSTTDSTWSDITSSNLDKTVADHPVIHDLKVETQYRLECEATISGGTNQVTMSRNVTFNLDSLSGSNTDDAKSVAKEIKKCKYVTTLDGRLVFYGNGTRQIYTSEVESPFYFTASEIVTADTFGKSEDILSINSFKDTHIIFTNTTMTSMTRVYPDKADSFWSILPLDGVVGAVGHNAVSPIENSLAFVSDEGVYVVGQISVAEKRVQLLPIANSIKDVVTTFNKDGKRMSDIFTANLEKRLFISFPDKKYMAVYDYNNAESITSGKWAIWDHMVPKQMEVDDFNLYFSNSLDTSDAHIDTTTLYVKNKRVYLDVHELSGDASYFTDNGGIYEFEYTSKNSALSEPMMYKKIKRISITADNWVKEDAKYDVDTTVDYQPDWKEEIRNIIYKNPTVDLTEPKATRGFLKLGKTMTTWRKSENIKTITNMKAKKGTVLNISIKNHSKGPISIKRIYIEYIHSNIRRFKSN